MLTFAKAGEADASPFISAPLTTAVQLRLSAQILSSPKAPTRMVVA